MIRSIAFLSLTGLLVAIASQIKNLPVAVSSSTSKPEAQPLINQRQDASVSRLSAYTRSISVKVMLEDSWGSGILIQRQGSVYTVLTNEHVLYGGKQYRIQTHDGHIYSAFEYKAISFKGKDLALLQFHSPNSVYPVAFLSKDATLVTGDEVFAGGFPFGTDSQSKGFKFTEGKVSLLIDKSFNGGYQVGYTNEIEKGMSGGPVVNLHGEVVAINGIHAYPIWGDPYVFDDGYKPCQPLHQLIVESNWAIPIETLIELIPKSFAIATSDSKQSQHPFLISQTSSSLDNSPKITSELRARAEAAKSCKGN